MKQVLIILGIGLAPLVSYLVLLQFEASQVEAEFEVYRNNAEVKAGAARSDLEKLVAELGNIWQGPTSRDISSHLDVWFDKDFPSAKAVEVFAGKNHFNFWREAAQKAGPKWPEEFKKILSSLATDNEKKVPPTDVISRATDYDYFDVSNVTLVRQYLESNTYKLNPFVPVLDFSSILLLVKIHLALGMSSSEAFQRSLSDVGALAISLLRSEHFPAVRAGLDMIQSLTQARTDQNMTEAVPGLPPQIWNPENQFILRRYVKALPYFVDLRVDYKAIHQALGLDNPSRNPFICAAAQQATSRLMFERLLGIGDEESSRKLIEYIATFPTCRFKYMKEWWGNTVVPTGYELAPVWPSYWIRRPKPPTWIQETIGKPLLHVSTFLEMEMTRRSLAYGYVLSNPWDLIDYE